MRARLLASALVAILIVGVVIARSMKTVDAQTGGRLSMTPAGNGIAFISDSSSGGCWLATLGGNGAPRWDLVVAIAPAPPAACK